MCPGEECFKRTSRIRKAHEYLDVKNRGKKYRSGSFFVSFAPKEKKRLGLVVPRGAGSAVERNRIKRVVRELFRIEREIFPCGDVVVVALPGSGKYDNPKIRKDVLLALKKIKAEK